MFNYVFEALAELFDMIPTSALIMLAVTYVLSFAFTIFLTVAIAKDCDAKGIKNKSMWTVLTFFFSPLVPIIYACCRNSAKKKLARRCLTCNSVVIEPQYDLCPNCNSYALQPIHSPDAEKKEKQGKIMAIIAIVCYVVATVLSMVSSSQITNAIMNYEDLYGYSDSDMDDLFGGMLDDFEYDLHYGYDVNGKTVFYDMKGNAYDDAEDVLYYDKQGNTYEYEEDDNFNYSFEDSTGKTYDGYYCYVDADGYFYYDVKDELLYDENSEWYFTYMDEEGNIYFDAISVSWDADGNLVDDSGDLLLSDEQGDLIEFE